ncbi:YdcF family protein [Bacillus sp. PS06]|uniref:YdcF family protein n=1 Tax=Bacillus sp. PS06 TaxID=2764176 RepID=UPI00178154CD|nr:YdcF family protein [Bacillus sp. PS06]MBD8067605.1 YdcF family protein [Bacillus sp. PS06]
MKKRKWMIPILLLVIGGLIYVGYLHVNIVNSANQDIVRDADYVIILGARVKGTTPSLSLQYRIDAAAEYLKENEHTIAIASGGQGTGEDISEAEAIKTELIKHGISEARILLENQSTSTNENIQFSKRLISDDMKTGLLVTNDYHVFRATMIANDYGLNLEGIPAKTPTIAIPKSYIREYMALTKYYLLKYTPF